MDPPSFSPAIPCSRPPSPSVRCDIILEEGGGGGIRTGIIFWGGRRTYVFASLSSVPLKSMGWHMTVIGEVYIFLNRSMLVFHGDGGGNGRIEMMIRLFLLVVQVLTPFYWTEIGFIREHFKEGRFSIGSLLLFHPPSCIPLVPCHRLLSPPHYSVPTPPPSFCPYSIPKSTDAPSSVRTKIRTAQDLSRP